MQSINQLNAALTKRVRRIDRLNELLVQSGFLDTYQHIRLQPLLLYYDEQLYKQSTLTIKAVNNYLKTIIDQINQLGFVNFNTGKPVNMVCYTPVFRLSIQDFDKQFTDYLSALDSQIDECQQVLDMYLGEETGTSGPDGNTPSLPVNDYQMLYANKYTLDTKDRNQMGFYYVQGGTVVNDNMYTAVESYGETRIVQSNVLTGQTTMLEGKFGRLSGIAQEAAQPTALGHANAIAGVPLVDGTVILWVAKMDTPGIVQLKIADGKATLVNEIKVLDARGGEHQVASLNIEAFDGENVTLGTHAILSGRGQYKTLTPFNVLESTEAVEIDGIYVSYELPQAIEYIAFNQPPLKIYNRLKARHTKASDQELKEMVYQELMTGIGTQFIAVYNGKAYSLHSKIDRKGKSFTLVLEHNKPASNNRWTPTGRYYYHEQDGMDNELYETEGMGVGTDGTLYLVSIIVAYGGEFFWKSKTFLVEQTNFNIYEDHQALLDD